MYLDFFQFKEYPFRLTPDPEYLFLSKQHAEASEYMDYLIWHTDGFVVVTGEIGSGKTTLLQRFMSQLDDSVSVAHLFQTQLTPTQFLQSALVEFGFKPFNRKKAQLLAMLRQYLQEQHALNRKVLLVVDEAQNLNDAVLEEIRLLSGVETEKEKILKVILMGQPELDDRLSAPKLEQLAQRVRLKFHLDPLSEEETRQYIVHRLTVAGAANPRLFPDNIISLIHEFTGGVPRLINTICDTVLICAFADKQILITPEIVESAVRELKWEPYAARAAARKAYVAGENPSPKKAPESGDASAAARTAPATLTLSLEGKPLGDFAITKDRLMIGRTRDNDIQLESEYVSRHHAQVSLIGIEHYIEDLNSTNGVRVNSKRIKRFPLKDGDIITIGKYRLKYVDRFGATKSDLAKVVYL